MPQRVSALEFVVQTIELARRAKDSLQKGKVYDARTVLTSLIDMDAQQIAAVEAETCSKELVDECVALQALARDALREVQGTDFRQATSLLGRIIRFESSEVLLRVQHFQSLKKKVRDAGFDVDLIVDPFMLGIDSYIKPLVVALRSLGFETDQSCHGHDDALRKLGPWVRVNVRTEKDCKRLLSAIAEYNAVSKEVRWEVESLPTTFVPHLLVMKADRREMSNDELRLIREECERIISRHRLGLTTSTPSRRQVAVATAQEDATDGELRVFYESIKHLENKGYSVVLFVPTGLAGHFNIAASGSDLVSMQKDILRFAAFLLSTLKT